MDSEGSAWDVIVVGAGPAGSSAALTAARRSVRVLALDKARLPRYKTGGGGPIGTSLANLPPDVVVPARGQVREIRFSGQGRWGRTRRAAQSEPSLFALVNRAEFDDRLVSVARRAGVRVEDGTSVSGIEVRRGDSATRFAVRTREGDVLLSRCIVEAAGSASRIGAFVGVTCGDIDLDLAAEVSVSASVASHWKNKVLLDWGRNPGTYGRAFAKGETLSVGVIGDRDFRSDHKAYFEHFVQALELTDSAVERSSGHLARCRNSASPVFWERVLVAGDAAGFLGSWTREGISFALRSGRLAGEYGALMARVDDDAVNSIGRQYTRAACSTLGEEMRVGSSMRALFGRFPALLHHSVTRLPLAWNSCARFTWGEQPFTDLVNGHAVVDTVLDATGCMAASRSGRVRASRHAQPSDPLLGGT